MKSRETSEVARNLLLTWTTVNKILHFKLVAVLVRFAAWEPLS
jgi:hypothetical protein